MSKIPLISLALVWARFDSLQRRGVPYGYGAKAPGLSCLPSAISTIDCSGAFRYLMYQGSKGQLITPDGSQMQREWAEKNLREVPYGNAARYMTNRRLFVAFIKPFRNGCGNVGHVWLLAQRGGVAATIESHGGGGIDSRRWNYPVLAREVYSCFELPTVEGSV